MDQLTDTVNTKSREIFQKDEELKKTRLELEILEDTELTVKKVVQEYQVHLTSLTFQVSTPQTCRHDHLCFQPARAGK